MEHNGQSLVGHGQASLSWLSTPDIPDRAGRRGDEPSRRVRFQVLGPLRVDSDRGDHTPRAPKVLQVLALLTLRANQNVHTDTLVQELWGDDPPRSALTTIQTYIYQLRRLFQRERIAERADQMLVTQAPGYKLRIDPEAVDLQRFLNFSREARRLLDRGRVDEASAGLRAALDLWTDEPLTNVRQGPQLAAYVVDLQEQRRNIHRLAIEADIERDLHRELIGELRALVARYPLDEWLHGQLMLVLDRSGRRSDALEVYQGLRGTLGDELGLDPSPEIQQIHCRVLGS